MLNARVFGFNLSCYRGLYGLFGEELIRGANLNTDPKSLYKFERRGDFKYLASGDIEKILEFSPLPVGYFDGSLEKNMTEAHTYLSDGKSVPEELMKEGKTIRALWRLDADERFPLGCPSPIFFQEMYLALRFLAELYELIESRGIKVNVEEDELYITSEEIKAKAWVKFKIDYNPRKLSHGDILKQYLRDNVRIFQPEEYSEKIFGDENRIKELFNEHRFDKETARRLRKGKAWYFKSLRDYLYEEICPAEAFREFLEDDSVDCEAKHIAPEPSNFNSTGALTLYYALKGIKKYG